jgi:uncharacterized protein YdaL
MRRFSFVLTLLLVAVFAGTASAGSVLILFDDYDGDWDYGPLYANMAANLVDHYGYDYRFLDATKYVAGDLLDYDAGIYIGTIYANPLSEDFLSDVANKVRPVFWVNYNIWQVLWGLSWGGGYSDVIDWGFTYNFGAWGTDYFDVEYNGQKFRRHELYHEVQVMAVTDPTRADVKASFVSDSDPANMVPYIVAGDGLWFCADNPFAWAMDASPYAVFSDALGEFLDATAPPSQRALVRLEDLAPGIADLAAIKKVGRYFKRQRIPFSFGVIPVFKDPTGAYFGYPVEIPLSEDPEFVAVIKKLQKWGGKLIMHGYTHQYDLASGDDWEFWEEIGNTPIPGDSTQWAQGRVDAALAEFAAVGLTPEIWETPHYSASQVDYEVFYDNFDYGYERTRAYNNFDSNSQFLINRKSSSSRPNRTLFYPRIRGAEHLTLDEIRSADFLQAGVEQSHSKAAGDEDVYILQYLTFLGKSIYGNVWIPENVGYLDPELFSAADLLSVSKKYTALNEPVASFFYHIDYPIRMLKDVIKGMRGQGYTFVSVDSLIAPAGPAVSKPMTSIFSK